MRLTGVLAACFLAATSRAAVTVTLTQVTEAAVVGYPLQFLIDIRNTGASEVNIHNLGVGVSPNTRGTVTFGNTSQNFSGTLAAGGTRQLEAALTATAPGPLMITIDVLYDALSATGKLSATVVDAAAVGTPPAGRMEIRHNVVRTRRQTGESTVPALVVLHGAAGGTVHLTVIGVSGHPLGDTGTVILDGQGQGTYLWKSWYDTGVYWIVATGAVNDRKPLLVLTYK